jgi:hypothetical protein
MNEFELIKLWNQDRNQLVLAQLAPTGLLITTSVLSPAIRDAGTFTVLGVLGILLASGILGALAEFQAANEAQAVADDLAKLASGSAISARIVRSAKWLHVAKYLTPAIFVAIFIALALALVGFSWG